MCVSVCPSPANLPLCGLLVRDVLCVRVCVFLTGEPASVESCREGCVVCVSVCPSPVTCLVQSCREGCVLCVVCVCVSLTGEPAPVRSCREGYVLCVCLCVPHR